MRDLFISARPPQGQGNLPAVPVALTGTVSDAPQGYEKLGNGDILRGLVVGKDNKGLTLIQTHLGQLRVNTQTALPPGTEVTLEIRQAGARVHIFVLQSIDNGTGPSDLTKVPAPASAALPHRSQPDDAISRQLNVRAIVQTPSPGGLSFAFPDLGGTLAPGNQLNVRILAVAQAAGQPIGPHSAPSNTAIPTDSPSLSPGAPPARSHGLPDSRSAGQNLSSFIRSVNDVSELSQLHKPLPASQPEQRPLPAAKSSDNPIAKFFADHGLKASLSTQSPEAARIANSALRFTAHVTGITANGHPIVRSPIGTLTLEVSSQIPRGSSLVLEISRASLAAPPEAGKIEAVGPPYAPSPSKVPETSLPHQMPGEGVLQYGKISLPIPQTNRGLGAGMILLLSILKGAKSANLLASKIASHESKAAQENFTIGREALVSGEASGLSRPIENGNGEWRLFLLPIFFGVQREHLHFYLRQQQGGGNGADDFGEPQAKRFVIEATLPKLGTVQLDGLIVSSRFDLLIRSERPLPPVHQKTVSKIFERGLSLDGWQGKLQFQVGEEDFLGMHAKVTAEGSMTV
ncbi:MAG: hypothetical protein R3245_00015 [Kiloniellales bacterium]|nr:hypothetical protein [Kiloniellales bacterium]